MTDDYDVMERALTAARYGLRVFPVRHHPGHQDDKAPLPGYGWTELASSSINHVVEDFQNAIDKWGHDGVMVAWALGLDGFCAVDLDNGTPGWVSEIADSAAINPTKRGEHLVFRNPPEFEPGNTDTKFPTSGWGEVRGKHGYIIIAGPDRVGLDVDDLNNAKPFPRPEWLEPYGGGAEDVSWEEVTEFAEKYNQNRTPHKLDAIKTAIDKWNPDNAGHPSKGRHPFAVWLMTTIAEEAMDGHYPYKDAVNLVAKWWKSVTPVERHGRELKGLATWGVGRAIKKRAAGTTDDLADLTATPMTVAGLFVGWNHEFPPPTPLIDGMIDLGTVGVIYARWGCFKSFLAIDWALHVACGVDWYGRPVRQTPVAILAYEAPVSIHRRAHAWSKHHELQPQADHYHLGAGRLPRLTNQESILEIRKMLDDLEVGFVVVDTIARGGVGADMNTHEADQVFNGLHLLGSPERAVLGVGHAGKDSSRGLRGFSAQEDQVDFLFRLDRERDKNTQQPIGPATLSAPKAKDREPPGRMTFDLVHSDRLDDDERVLLARPTGKFMDVSQIVPDDPATIAVNRVKDKVSSDPDQWWPVSVLIDSCRAPRSKVQRPDVRDAIDQLVELQFLERHPGEPGGQEMYRMTDDAKHLES